MNSSENRIKYVRNLASEFYGVGTEMSFSNDFELAVHYYSLSWGFARMSEDDVWMKHCDGMIMATGIPRSELPSWHEMARTYIEKAFSIATKVSKDLNYSGFYEDNGARINLDFLESV